MEPVKPGFLFHCGKVLARYAGVEGVLSARRLGMLRRTWAADIAEVTPKSLVDLLAVLIIALERG